MTVVVRARPRPRDAAVARARASLSRANRATPKVTREKPRGRKSTPGTAWRRAPHDATRRRDDGRDLARPLERNRARARIAVDVDARDGGDAKRNDANDA